MADPAYTVVIPTVGRPELARLLASLDVAPGPAAVVVVDDRRRPDPPLDLPEMVGCAPVRRMFSGGRGPAAARNAGWRAEATEWVAFLDDDVVVGPAWCADLAGDLAACGPLVGASQGRVEVPLPEGRRPTDWERNVAGLAAACWATADMAYRRHVLEEVGGFDERFPRAYREDSDLALRVERAGWLVVRGDRTVSHPVRPAGPAVSVRLQAGNADDVLMRALHGPDWRVRVAAGPGRNRRHWATTAALLAAASLRRRPLAAGLATAVWAGLWAEFAWSRIAPGPRTAREVATMAVTSAAIPPAAVYHSLRGLATLPRVLGGADRPVLPTPSLRGRLRFGPVPRPVPADPYWAPKAVLFDRDGTLIADRHYLADPAGVAPLPGARRALAEVRRAGLATGVVTNQSGVGRGLMTEEQMLAVNDEVDRRLGPFDAWAVCVHRPGQGCPCRKPAAGLVLQAAAALGVSPSECAVIGDIGADMEAARAAGARAVMVPTRRTRRAEIRAAPHVAPDLPAAVDLVLGGRC